MDLNSLETFIQIADTKSFSQSAKNMNLSQPAVSKRIAALESSLSRKLFDREGGTVRLTEFGQVLLPSARQIQVELKQLVDAIDFVRTGVSGPLRIGVAEQTGKYKLPRVLQQFRDTHPDVSIDLKFKSASGLIAGMENEQFELALVSSVRGWESELQESFDVVELWCEDIVPVISIDSELAGMSPVGQADLIDISAILAPPGAPLRRLAERYFGVHSRQLSVLMESDDFDLIRSMVSSGLGWGFIPESTADSTMKKLSVDGFVGKYTTGLVKRRERTLSRAADAFIELLPRV